MSIKTEWTSLSKTVEENQSEELSFLKDLVALIKLTETSSTEENIKLCEEEFNIIHDKLLKLPEKDYISIERLLKNQIVSLKSKFKKSKIKRVTRWDIFVEEAYERDDWNQIVDLINYVEKKETEEITEEDIKEFENKITVLNEYMRKNLTPYDNEWALKEFKKKLRIFKNRISRNVEDDFGKWVKELRLSKGYSLMELESKTGVTASYIYRIETGQRKTPSITIAEKLAKGLDVSTEAFFKKLNLLDLNDDKLKSFVEIISVNKFTLTDNKEVNSEQKNLIIELFRNIVEAKWTENSKLPESMKILDIIEKLKKSL